VEINLSDNEVLIPTKQAYQTLIDDHTIDLPMAIALKVPRRVGDPNKSVNFLADSRDLSQTLDDATVKKIFGILDKLYLFEDIYGRSLDLWVDFGATRLDIQDTGNEEFDNLISYWRKHLNEKVSITARGEEQFKRLVFQQWFNMGNCFPYENWERVEINGKMYNLPTKIICLNPNNIEINSDAAQFGIEQISLQIPYSYMGKDGRSNPEIMLFKKKLSPNIKKQIRNNTFFGGSIPLNSRLVTHLKRKGNHHSVWGIPFGLRSLNAFADLHRKREMDSSVVESMIRRILLFKLGNDEYPCNSDRLLAFRSLFENPESNFILVTPHDVQYEDISPKTDILDYEKKYEHEMTRISVSLGIPPILLGLKGSNKPDVEISAFAESLQDPQMMYKNYIENVVEKIAEQNDMEVPISAKMARVNINKLMHMTTMRDVFLSGTISRRTYVESIDFDFETEVQRIKDEKEQGIDLLMTPPAQPFQGNNQGIDKEEEPQTPNEEKQDKKKKMKRENKN